jgi:DNA-binding PadR family transcriptional regulator
MFSIIPEDTLDVLRDLFGSNVDALGKDELTILATCHIEGEVSNSRLQYMIDQHKTEITRILQELCKQGYLISENKGRWTTYHLNSEGSVYFENRKLTIVDTSSNLVDTSSNLVDTSSNLVDTSSNLVDTSNNLVDTPNSKRKDWVKKEVLHQQIINLCKDEFKSIEDISKVIHKDIKYLKNTIVPELVKSGKLERLYPNINHPNQAYKSNL